ncbi:nucleotide sugar dehydrogenase [Pedobacter sp. KR3-3]|uniref:Nucleotide sugar dehydrogenase n=1 Tax=Pedobacter albus TaxID=3113905 RepID=A0ABU7IBJ0_9SPHI|nr:nucleotide sugar dehydrogenase [Pedobacter sp. KR3-3]MEE1946842.1 nucleotide sugar dehydrogenase [Pedobacter sp. KR3-3]
MSNYRIAVIGLGYVGLPLAVEFGKKYSTLGFDIDKKRIAELKTGVDKTLEVDHNALSAATKLNYSDDPEELRNYNIFIITVPTPVDKYNKPDLTPLKKASEIVGKVLDKGDIVIYESTVYPGTTEEECVPILENYSGLIFNQDFYCGYSPERINPGDKEHTVSKILKVTSGSTPEIAEIVDQLYGSIITAGTFKASCIKVAEAAKVIENSQRDINIAFVNELSKIFNLLGIDTKEVLEAAGTKWNFLKFSPGLVGGHCIGVDPYYLAQKAQEVGYHPEIILAGRRLNDSIGSYVADETIKLLVKKQINVALANVLVLGITFKENCPDVRNTKVVDIIKELAKYHVNITVLDPWADRQSVKHEYGLDIINSLDELVEKQFDGIVLAVAHREFLSLDISKMRKEKSVIYDVKGILPKHLIDKRL